MTKTKTTKPTASFKDTLEALLKTDSRLTDANKELNLSLIRELVNKTDASIIELLLSNEDVKRKFFLPVKNVLVFKQADFKFFLEANGIDNSYTAYENRIGLGNNSGLLKDNSDVVLNFPYKDCLLEGGQSTEEGTDDYYEYNGEEYEMKTAPRKEIFFNEVVAQDEIDRLLEPKAFTNIKKYSAKGEEKLKGFTRNENGVITDNLIIKGNNLLALHSLKEQFKGQVKLIYIDPPYNTGSDSFAYNDKFNHSTWLAFMTNRLKVAKSLLREDGVIFISADDNEYTYLRSIMDEVFTSDGFENIFHIKVRHENRILRQDARYQKVLEQMLCYSMPTFIPNRIGTKKDKDSDYQYEIKIKKAAKPIATETIGGYEVEIFSKSDYEILKEEKGSFKEYNIRGSLITQKGSASEFYELNLRSRKRKDGLGTLYRVNKMGEKGDGLGYRYIRQPFDNGNNGFYYQGRPVKTQEDKGNPFPNYYDFEKEFNNASDEGGVIFKNGKKPELFLKKIIEISDAQPGDLILDFHLGSGSLAATAHKMGFRYIGVEQIDKQVELIKTRLSNVIKGDTTGISKLDDVDWKGGGSFIYMELKKHNEEAKDKIATCKSLEELKSLFKELTLSYFLNYNVRVKDFIEGDPTKKKVPIIDEEAFKKLSLKKQKEMFAKMLDLNQLYVAASEMEDSKYNLSKDDIALTNNFYNLK